jgi:hypothetical protein
MIWRLLLLYTSVKIYRKDFLSMDIRIALALVSIFLLNILFGYWRSNTKKLSIQWMMSIHVPVPIAIGLRLSLLGWSWPLLPAFVTAFATGQYAGGKIRHYFAGPDTRLTSFLVIDIVRAVRGRAPRRIGAQ